MPGVSRVTAIWTGFPGAPGYSKFSFRDLTDVSGANAAGAQVRAFFEAIKAYLPGGTTVSVQPQVDELDIVSGELLGSFTMSTIPTAVISATAATNYAGGSGFAVTWTAPGVFNGRRLKNRTYIVPSVGAHFTDGTVAGSAVTAVQAAGATFIAGSGADLAVWNRQWTEPPDPRPSSWKPTPIAGSLASATTCTVRDMSAQLRSRRL